MTTFSKGQLVKANVTAQGMTKGNTYKIVEIIQRDLMWGSIVTYLIAGNSEECKDGLLHVGNGHLLLSEANA